MNPNPKKEGEGAELPLTQEQKDAAEQPALQPLKHEAALYTSWKQMPTSTQPAKYFVVIHKTFQDGRVKEYELLRLFEPELADIDPYTFSDLVERKLLVAWNEY